ncbi:MAG: histidine triad nucleotide-binding protein [Candidatus Obscuribacterales bacterium]
MEPSKTASRDCIFCKIIERHIPSNVVQEDETSIAIRDVNPQAPTHILILPKIHVANITEVKDAQVLGSLFMKVGEVAKAEKLDHGFRTVVNTGEHGGQTVDHLHIHVIGGRQLDWPPG